MRIFDTFPFDGELNLLSHRLEEMFDLVDGFVIVEAGQTYRGAPKAFAFADNRELFRWADAKIRHVKLSSLGPGGYGPRERAAVQRNAILLALHDARPEDVVLLLDVDEVPSRGLLERLRSEGIEAPRRLAMTRHYGFLDRLGPRSSCCPAPKDPFACAPGRENPGRWDRLDPIWYGHSGVAAPFSTFCGAAQCPSSGSPFTLRFGLPMGDPLPDAGRHLSSVDPSTLLQDKLKRVFHEEWDGTRATSAPHLDRCRRLGIHHRGWWYAERPTGALPDDLQRLAQRFPGMEAGASLPWTLTRRLGRSWAWLRLWKGLPDRLVAYVDFNLEQRTALLAAPLLLADIGRSLIAAFLRMTGLRWPGPPTHRQHL